MKITKRTKDSIPKDLPMAAAVHEKSMPVPITYRARILKL